MKKIILSRIAIFAFVLCMVSTYLLSGTLAKYTTEANGTGDITVAKFTDIDLKKGENSLLTTFALSTTKNTNIKTDSTKIAPGDQGQFNVVFGASEVTYSYSISIGKHNGDDPFVFGEFNEEKAIPVKFYSNSEMTNEITEAYTGTFNLEAAKAGQSVTIYWKWDTETDALDNSTEELRVDDVVTDTFAVKVTAVQDVTTGS